MADRKSTKNLIRQALSDAIDWQLGLADAWPAGSEERREALEQAKAYRELRAIAKAEGVGRG